MTSHTGKQKITIHILSNILKSKDNQTMKFGQLKEYNMRNIFLEKPYTKCGQETSSRPFSEKLKLSMSPDQYSKVLYIFFIICQVEGYQKILKLSFRPLSFISYKAFLKNKKRSRINLPALFSARFLKEYIYLVILY